MRCSTPHSVKLSTARKLPRFVKNPPHKARIRVGNFHRRPFPCRGSATNRVKSQAGLRKLRRKQFCARSRTFRYAVVIEPSLGMSHGVW